MVTPKEYQKYLTQGVCDEQMLAEVIYSYNKRAKNHRDTRNYYRRAKWDNYDNEGRAMAKMEEYYGKKHNLLYKLFTKKAVCIHAHTVHKRKRVYDYEKEYESITDYVYSNCYYDYVKDEEVYFVDYIEDIVNYFLCFRIGDKSFHSPIEMEITDFLKQDEFQHLEIIDLPEDFYTEGQDRSDLLSVQFCDKVYKKFVLQAA